MHSTPPRLLSARSVPRGNIGTQTIFNKHFRRSRRRIRKAFWHILCPVLSLHIESTDFMFKFVVHSHVLPILFPYNLSNLVSSVNFLHLHMHKYISVGVYMNTVMYLHYVRGGTVCVGDLFCPLHFLSQS